MALISAVKVGESREEIRRVLQTGVNINETDEEGYTALHHAVLK